MTFGSMPGDTAPPAWLAFVVGLAIIGYCFYEAGRVRRDNERAVSDLLRTFLVFLMGMVIVAYGMILSLHS